MTPPRPTPAAVSLQRVLFLANELEREVARLLGIGLTDYRALSALMRAGELTVGDLARAIGATAATTTALANRLEAAGHLRRVRHGSDQRKVLLRVTPDTADEVLALMRPAVESSEAHLGGLDEHDLGVVTDFTAAVAEALDAHLATLAAAPAPARRTTA